MPASPDFIDATPNRTGLLGLCPCLPTVEVRLRLAAGGLP